MKIEKQFNKRSADLIEVQPPSISTSPHLALGIKATFFRLPGGDGSAIAMHLSADEALGLAGELIKAAQEANRYRRA